MQSMHGLLEPSVPEFRIEDSSVVLPPGYGESKHVSERIYLEASRRSHVPTIVYRVGQIAGPTTNAELASTVAVFHWTFVRNMSYRTDPVHYTCIGSANISQENNHAASTTFTIRHGQLPYQQAPICSDNQPRFQVGAEVFLFFQPFSHHF